MGSFKKRGKTTAMALNDYTVANLRKLARDTPIKGITGILIAGANKMELVEAIEQGVWPSKEVVPQAAPPSNNGNGLGKVIADEVSKYIDFSALTNPVTEDQIKGWIKENQPESVNEDEIKKLIAENQTKAKRIEIVKPDGKTKDVGIQHKLFPQLLQVVQLREHAWISGPAGGGKTTAAKNVAEALDLTFYPVSVCKQTTAYQMMGHLDLNGKYVESDVYRAYTNGGLLLIDEVDGGNANVTMALNAVLANGVANFPCGVKERHPDFICIAGANTMGHGATREYVGRNPLDAAFIDRFGAKIIWSYDEDLETAICGNEEWAKYVQACRKAAKDLGIKCVISPRASISGAKLLKVFKREDVEQMTLWNEIGDEAARRIQNKAKVS